MTEPVLAWLPEVGDWYNDIRTRPDFGCVLFEPKDKTDGQTEDK